MIKTAKDQSWYLDPNSLLLQLPKTNLWSFFLCDLWLCHGSQKQWCLDALLIDATTRLLKFTWDYMLGVIVRDCVREITMFSTAIHLNICVFFMSLCAKIKSVDLYNLNMFIRIVRVHTQWRRWTDLPLKYWVNIITVCDNNHSWLTTSIWMQAATPQLIYCLIIRCN